MKIRILQRILLCFVLLLAACQANEYPLTEEGTSLCITLKSADNSIYTRGVEDLDDNGSISDEEMILDGRKIYRLALFLMDGNTVAGNTVLESGDQRFSDNNTKATVEFGNLDYSKTYQLYAIANYGNYNNTLTGHVTNVSASTLNNITISTTDNICPKNKVYPLTLKQQINLTPGMNTVSGQLKRTFARLRINVRNQSTDRDLQITSLSFPAKFAQTSTNLFTESGTASATPKVASTGAITPFDANNAIVAKINTDGTVNETTIFDTYLLESNGGTYTYTLGLKYTGGTEEKYTVSEEAITNNQNIENGAMYVISNTQTNANRKSLYANGSTVGIGSSYNNSDGTLNNNYVWRFNKTSGDNNYTIESMGTKGNFMQSSSVSSNSVPLITNPTDNDYITVDKINNNRTLKSTTINRWGYSYYIAITGNSVVGSTNKGEFKLYKVTKGSETTSLTHNAPNIPIQIVDKNSGEATPLPAIRRNDFIEILVNVTYNEKTGNIEYKVSDWTTVNGEVTFD